MKRRLLLTMGVFALLVMGLGNQAKAETVTDTIFDRKLHEQDFAFGADISFVSQMESWNTVWRNKEGIAKDIFEILKEQGINNVRLRVWVNPAGGWCGKNDVVKLARRAHAKGMGIMLCFHYSDTWADPGTQDRPAAWANHTVAQLEQDVYDHTHDIISALKTVGITPRWAQIGNETKRGMFYPTAQTNKGGTDNFAKMLKAGIKAVKDIDPEIKTIIHLPDGHDNSLYRSMFDQLKNRGVVWDIIGMSAYPRWSHLDGPTMITRVMANIRDLKQRYKTPVMVVETGHYWNKPIEANNYLVGLMDAMIKNGDPGVFYWEPESLGGYELGAWDTTTNRPTVAMDAFLGLKYTEVSWVMKASVSAPQDNETVVSIEDLLLKANISHIQNKTVNVEFYIDNKKVGTVNTKPYELQVSDIKNGMHTLWAKAIDDAKHVQTSDTITFFLGESQNFTEAAEIVDGDKKGGVMKWNVNFREKGKYALLFHYDADKIKGVTIKADADSLGKLFFSKGMDEYMTKEVEINETGNLSLTLTANYSAGLPSVKSLRIFPLEGQAVPEQGVVDAIHAYGNDNSPTLYDLYDLSGRYITTLSQHQLGVSLGSRESAVVVLPNCVGGTPNIVRKHRLK